MLELLWARGEQLGHRGTLLSLAHDPSSHNKRLSQSEDGLRLLHGARRGSTGAVRMSGGGRTPAGAVEHSPLAELQTVKGGA